MNTLKLRLFTLPLLAFGLALPATSASAQPLLRPFPGPSTLHPIEMQRLTEQFKKLCPPQGWTVMAKNNEILIRCEKPLSTYTIPLGTLPTDGAKPIKVREVYQFTLRVAMLVTPSQYDQLVAENLTTQQKNRDLLRKYGFDAALENGVTRETDQQSAPYLSYVAASKKLNFIQLPTFYSKEYSFIIEKASSWYHSTKPADAEVKEQSRAVEAAFLKNFGSYESPIPNGDNPFIVDTKNRFGIVELDLPFQGNYSPWELEVEPPATAQ